MYNNEIKNILLNIYNELPNYNIRGIKRKNIINNIFKGRINSIYNWLINKQNKVIKRTYKNKKITNTIEQFILNEIKVNPVINIKTIKNKILKTFNISISKSSIYYVIKNNNLTYKKTKIETNPYSIEEQKEQLKNKKEVIDHLKEENIISIDETSIVLSSKPSYGWSLKGKKCIIKNNKGIINDKRYSLVMAITNKNVIDFSIVKKALNGDKFLKFIKKLKRKDKENKMSYLMDNCVIHRTKKLKEYVKKEKMHLIYNVPYHSETNPIETVFSVLKNKINRSINNSYADVIKIIVEFKKEFKEKLSNIYRNSFKLYSQIL